MHELPSLRQLIAKYNVQADKKLGQHFLIDESIPSQMVLSTPEINGQTVLEVGPGPGALTRVLVASKAARIVAVELDKRFAEWLEPLQAGATGKLEVLYADALKVNEEELMTPGAKLHVMANLPYNIGTALLCKWLERPSLFGSITVMLQKEVADRITAVPRTKDYGRLSIITQWLCEVENLLAVPPACFLPPPKVMSAVVRIIPRPRPLYQCKKITLERLTSLAFNQRRKMLRSVLKGLIPDIEAQLVDIGANPTARAEELSVEQFCLLAQKLATD